VSSEPTRVLIAEDEALIRLDLKEMLEEEGYAVVAEVADGQQAVDRAQARRLASRRSSCSPRSASVSWSSEPGTPVRWPTW
jgi:CheY-like chemotaxis protein